MSAGGNTPAGGPKKHLVWILAIAGVAMLFLNQIMSGSSSVDTAAPAAPERIEIGDNQINQISATDKDAALVQFAKKMDAVIDRQERAERTREQDRKREEAERNKLRQEADSNSRALADAIAKLQQDLIQKEYEGINAIDKGQPIAPSVPQINLPSGGLDFDSSFDFGPSAPPTVSSPQSSAAPYGPNYTVLAPKQPHGAPGANGEAQAGLFNDIKGPNTNAFNQAAARTDVNMRDTLDREPRQEPIPADANLTAEQLEAKRKRDTVEVNAFSFVEVTTLHGASCPIGANSPGSNGDAKVQARPIVLPAHGIFRGPNGSEVDLGTIHLMGLCSGRRTSSSKTGRALIRIEQLSYWDANGGAQMVPAVGYIVDTRDNDQDVYGKLDRVSSRTLALQSAAAAAAAYSSTLSAAEFTNTNTVDNGTSNVTSQLTGDATSAALSQGIGATFKEISDRFKAEADAAMDTVLVEPGIKLRFVTELPIRVVKPLEPFDINASMYDILI